MKRHTIIVLADMPDAITGMQAQHIIASMLVAFKKSNANIVRLAPEALTEEQQMAAICIADSTFTVTTQSNTPDEQLVHHMQALGWFRMPNGRIAHRSDCDVEGYATWTDAAAACITIASEA